jgi:phosphate transport system protein
MNARQLYDQKLDALYQETAQMGNKIIDMIESAKQLIQTRDTSLIDSIKEIEKQINTLEVSLEDQFVLLIATEHPVAHDLRKIIASIKLISHLERVGDYAVHVAKQAKKLSNRYLKEFAPSLVSMLETSLEMLQGTLEAFLEDQAEKAKTIASLDDQVDKTCKQYIQMVFSRIKPSEDSKEFASALLLGKSIERLSDHITNICEWIVYADKNEHVELNS